MTAPNVLVVSIDGFGVAAAGAYGQTSLPTPGWNSLAANAVTFDFVDAPAATLAGVLSALMNGSSEGRATANDAIRQFAERGGTARIAGDLAEFDETGARFVETFGERCEFDLAPAVAPAEEEDATQALRWLESAEREIKALAASSADGPTLLWLHHRGAYGSWDAPLDWREALRDEEDPPAYADIAPPHVGSQAAAGDPDRFLPYVFAWAGQAAAWDRLAEGLFLLWKRLDAKRPTRLIVFGLRGYPLGEHGVVGDGNVPSNGLLLQEERLHVPFFVVPPGGAFPGKRFLGVRRSDELLADLLSQDELPGEIDQASQDHPFAVATEGASVSVRTAAWRFVRDEAGARLYFKPDDKWEANDVAARRRDTVEAFERWLEERSNGVDPPLPEEATRL
jgi:hypothetical protein